MGKVLVIPDVHLKPWMFVGAEEALEKGQYDQVVLLGDIADDWGQERNRELYAETFDALLRFMKTHPESLFCYGNHDLSYVWNAYESGFSAYVRELVMEKLKAIEEVLPVGRDAYIHRIDNVLFSHGGLTESFVREHFGRGDKVDIDYIIERVNKMGKPYMWKDDSPIWARPQYGKERLYSAGLMQVVGHTPVEAPLEEENLLSLDTFSTYRAGTPIGDGRFVWVDTIERTWGYAGGYHDFYDR